MPTTEDNVITLKKPNHKPPRIPKPHKPPATRLHTKSAVRGKPPPPPSPSQTHQENQSLNSNTHETLNQHKHQKSKMNLSFINPKPHGASAFQTHKFRGVQSGVQGGKKAILQIEQDNDEDMNDSEGTDYEDYDEHEDPHPPPSEYLDVGLRPIEPTPPKLSDETVISVSNVADMASAFKGEQEKTAFVGDDDLIISAVNISKNLGEMSQMVNGFNTSMRKSQGPHTNTVKPPIKKPGSTIVTSVYQEDDPREYEKVFREYTNSRSMYNPVCSSLKRILLSKHKKTHRQLSSNSEASMNNQYPLPFFMMPKKVHALSATTTNNIHGFNERSRVCSGDTLGTSPHLTKLESSYNNDTLNEIWNSGWRDPDPFLSNRRRTQAVVPPPSSQAKPQSAQTFRSNVSSKNGIKLI